MRNNKLTTETNALEVRTMLASAMVMDTSLDSDAMREIDSLESPELSAGLGPSIDQQLDDTSDRAVPTVPQPQASSVHTTTTSDDGAMPVASQAWPAEVAPRDISRFRDTGGALIEQFVRSDYVLRQADTLSQNLNSLVESLEATGIEELLSSNGPVRTQLGFQAASIEQLALENTILSNGAQSQITRLAGINQVPDIEAVDLGEFPSIEDLLEVPPVDLLDQDEDSSEGDSLSMPPYEETQEEGSTEDGEIDGSLVEPTAPLDAAVSTLPSTNATSAPALTAPADEAFPIGEIEEAGQLSTDDLPSEEESPVREIASTENLQQTIAFSQRFLQTLHDRIGQSLRSLISDTQAVLNFDLESGGGIETANELVGNWITKVNDFSALVSRAKVVFPEAALPASELSQASLPLSFENASPVSLDQNGTAAVTGNLTAGTQGVFSFDIPQGPEREVVIQAGSDAFDTTLSLFDSSEELLQSNDDIELTDEEFETLDADSFNTLNSRIISPLSGGRFFAVVEPFDQEGEGPFELNIATSESSEEMAR